MYIQVQNRLFFTLLQIIVHVFIHYKWKTIKSNINANTKLRRHRYFFGKYFLTLFFICLKDIFRVIPKAKRVEMNEEEKASVKTILQGKGITKAKKDRLLEVLFECIVLFIDVPEDEDSDVDKNRYHAK